MNLYKTLLLIIFLSSCTNYNIVRYKEADYDSDDNLNLKIKIPIGYNMTKNKYDHSTEYLFTYKDSSTLFISNNKFSGARINQVNRIKKGIDVIFRKHINDTIKINGKTKDRYWLEHIYDNFCIGYMNVSKKDKQKFDNAINSVKK